MTAGSARRTFAPDGLQGASLNPCSEPEAQPRGYTLITSVTCFGTWSNRHEPAAGVNPAGLAHNVNTLFARLGTQTKPPIVGLGWIADTHTAPSGTLRGWRGQHRQSRVGEAGPRQEWDQHGSHTEDRRQHHAWEESGKGVPRKAKEKGGKEKEERGKEKEGWTRGSVVAGQCTQCMVSRQPTARTGRERDLQV